MTSKPPKAAPPPWPIMERPGFLFRRLYQIHVALFAEHCAKFDITPVQYSILSALALRGTADQTSLATDVLLDRTTTTGALIRLEKRSLVERVTSGEDRRARLCKLTRLGTKTLVQMEELARKAHHETISPLTATQQDTLMGLLRQLVAAHGNESPTENG